MTITIEELQKEGFEIKGQSSLPWNVLEMAKAMIDTNSDVKQIRIYKGTELKDGKNPNHYYLFIRK